MDYKSFLGSHPIRYPAGFAGLSVPHNWITDAVIAARFCKTGLSGLDYHGKQPVSRNAQILTGSTTSPALQFGFSQNGFIPLTLGKYEAAPWCCFAELLQNEHSVGELFAMAQGKSIFFNIELTENKPFSLRFNSGTLNTNVHGHMVWKRETGDFPLIFTGENHYKLSDWVSQKGAYLVPVSQHTQIFGTDPLLDVNNLDVLPPMIESVKNSDELFINSRTVLILDSAHPVQTTEENGIYTLTFTAQSNSIRFNLSFGDSVEEAKAESARFQNTYSQAAKQQILRYQKIAGKQPSVTFNDYTELDEIFNALPGYVQAATQKSGMTRASASSYYWVWGWDNLVTAHELSKWGDLKGQRAIIEFFLTHRWRDSSVPHRYGRDYEVLQTMQFGAVDCLLISLIYQHFCETGDALFLKECYPTVLELWNGLKKKADSRGFIKGLGFYPDNPRAMGRTETGVTSIETGAFYLAARLISEIATTCNDSETAELTAQTADLIESNYLKAFFNPATGGLLDGLDDHGNPNQIYPLYDYLAAHSRQGLALYLPKIGQIADFIGQNYLTDLGIRTLPASDSHTHTESVHHSWYLHWDIHALKLMRYGALAYGDNERFLDISRRYVKTICRMWNRCRAVMELADFDDLDPETGWTKFGQAWNLNCATGLYRTILESLAGIVTDGGTITVLPGGLSAKIDGLWAYGGRWSFDRTGMGDFSHLIVDNVPIFGACTIPKEFYTSGEHHMTAVYGTPYQNPSILDYIGGKISELKQTEHGITCRTTGTGKLLLLSNSEPIIAINGIPAKAQNLHARLWQLLIKTPATLIIGGKL
ncbi:MAG TPA: hypothetical protein PK629_09470 [Oscillospiraceae bacterium]|nr:hypothetical protein [Oscillospiraceae bacterium]HPF54959.1 hypothetical protein [Clostridiales bacterium]HPK34372.1 hypothetical protein [Oscillospiraceae bacterium]HPR75818.1 hypothetical protein [Oscillospiraceae bacterium]